MKMRVRGYDEHRLRDPYKYWAKLLDTPPKRKRKALAHWTYVTRIDEHNLQFYMQLSPDGKQYRLCTLADNDTWTISIPPKELLPSHGNRLYELMRVHVSSQKKNFPMHENAYRIGPGWANTLPYEPGVQVYKGNVVDPEKYVDRVRVIEKDSALDVKRKLKKIYELAPVMVRLLQSQQGDRKPLPYWTARQLREKWFAEVDLDNINGLDAERVYLLGEAVTTRHTRWQFNYGKPASLEYRETDQEYWHRCIVNGLRRLREHIYSKEGVYQYKPVKN